MKIKFKDSDGTILAIGAMPDLTAGVGETVEDFIGETPSKRIDFYKRVSPGVIEEKSQAEKDAIKDSEKTFTKARVKNYVNAGATLEDKVDRLIKVVANLANQVKESDI